MHADEQDALRLIVERLCQCDAKFVTLERVTLPEFGQPRDVAVFALDGHPEKVGTAYAWRDCIADCNHHRVVLGTGVATSPEMALRDFFRRYGTETLGEMFHRAQ
jgi:hypothetical protein